MNSFPALHAQHWYSNRSHIVVVTKYTLTVKSTALFLQYRLFCSYNWLRFHKAQELAIPTFYYQHNKQTFAMDLSVVGSINPYNQRHI